MKRIRLMVLVALLPAVGCMSMPVKEKEPTAARGKDADVVASVEEETTTAMRPDFPRIAPEDISESNYQQQLDALREELLRDRSAIGAIDNNRPAFAERK